MAAALVGIAAKQALQLVNRRKASDYAELYGLADVDYAAQVGAFANFWPVSWLRLRGEVRQGIGGETGVTGDIFLDAVVPVGQWTISGGPRVTLQTAAATSPYFSITAAQAITANALQPGLGTLTAYNAGGGLYSYGAGTQLQYTFSPTWTAHAFVEYQRLTDSAAGSPLVTQRGSPTPTASARCGRPSGTSTPSAAAFRTMGWRPPWRTPAAGPRPG